jgi:hypothetical protein
MRQCKFEQIEVARFVTELFADKARDFVFHSATPVYPLPMRLALKAVNHVHGFQ